MNHQTMFYTISCIVSFILVVHLFIPNIEAITINKPTNATKTYLSQSNRIGIQLSPTCITLIKNHMNTTCPTYDKLKPLDNTNPIWAGQWINDTYYHRHLPRVSNHYLMNQNTFIVMVDPDPNFTTISKMIIIQAGNFTYTNPSDSIGNNHTRNEYQNRFVSGCTEAIVAPLPSLIEDTLHYMESGCKITAYKEKVTTKTKDTPFQYGNPYSSLHYKNQINQLKQHPMGDCIHKKCDISNPYKKKGW
jgi:hypothetical protein